MDDKKISEKDMEILSGSAKSDYDAARKKTKEIKKQQKERAKDERYKEKAAARREKNRQKAEKREQRAYYQTERKRLEKERTEKHFGGVKRRGLIAAVITLALSTAILGGALAYTAFVPVSTDNRLESGYRKSFYDTVVQVDNMDLNLSKALASKDEKAVQTYLVDLAVNSELAENNLQQLPIEDENKFYTTKIVNQVGDFAKYLNKKLVQGEDLSAADYENLKNLYKANAALKNALQSAMRNMGADYDFSDMGKAFNGNALLNNFDRLQELSVEYPELIYDGPFSDGKETREIKGLSGEKITAAEAEEIFVGYFSEYSPKRVQSAGKSTGAISAFCVQAEINGDTAYAQISETGGKLIMYAYAGSCNGVNYEQYYLTEKALAFLEKAGFNDMRAVWVNLNNNVYTINFAPEISGAIIYPDLVKVRLCAETGMVIGLEATGYYTNHVEREIEKPVLSATQARAKVSEDIATETVRLAVVPVGDSAETLCYEFSGELNGETYYVYIDAINGRQVEMFKVIDSEEGSLLM